MSPRPDIRMDEIEVSAFLRSSQRAVVVALDSGGVANGAVGQLVHGSGEFRFVLRGDDPVVALLAHDGRACCVVEQFPSYYEIKGVMVHGRAEPVAAGADGQAAFALAVEAVTSYDFGKLRTP
jgi:hypothetical protein